MTDTTDSQSLHDALEQTLHVSNYTASDPIGVPTTSTAECRICQTNTLTVKCFEGRGHGVVYNPSLVCLDYEKHYKPITRSPGRDVNPG